MPIPAKNVIRARDIRIAKVGRSAKVIPCQQIFALYLENLRSGRDGDVPSHIMKALNDCGEEWERTSKHQGASLKYQLSLFKRHKG